MATKLLKPKQQTVLFDGVKAVSAWDVDSMQGWTLLGGVTTSTETEYFRTIPWLYRAVKDRSNLVGRMPFAILKNGIEIDSSSNYQNKLECLPNPTTLFKRLEMSIAITGRAYVLKETNNNGYVKNLKYLVPTTIKEVYSKDGTITGYERTVNGQNITLKPEQIIAIYDPDHATENGPGVSSAVTAALQSAGVLYNADRFVSSFFERGAIKATILTTLGFSQSEAERMQHWWEDVVTGIKNAWSAVVLRGEGVKATVVGEGLESLQNDSLTTSQRQNIATALGVPESRMWSSAANYATANSDMKMYYDATIIPDCDLIAEGFKTQLFIREHKLEGYTLDYQYETIDVFQADVAQQANAMASLKNSGIPLLMAADLVGLELTDEQRAELEGLQDEPKTEQAIPAQPDTASEMPANETELVQAEYQPNDQSPFMNDMRRWQRKAAKRVKDGKPAACEFESDYIDGATHARISTQLQACKTADDVKSVFDNASQPQAIDILSSLREIVEVLRNG